MKKKREKFMSGILVLLINDIRTIDTKSFYKYLPFLRRFKINNLIKKSKKDIISRLRKNKFTNFDIVSLGLLYRTAEVYNILDKNPDHPIIYFAQDHTNTWPMTTEVLMDIQVGGSITSIKFRTYMSSEFDTTTPITVECCNQTRKLDIENKDVYKDTRYNKEFISIDKGNESDNSTYFDLLYNVFIIYIESIFDTIKERYL